MSSLIGREIGILDRRHRVVGTGSGFGPNPKTYPDLEFSTSCALDLSPVEKLVFTSSAHAIYRVFSNVQTVVSYIICRNTRWEYTMGIRL